MEKINQFKCSISKGSLFKRLSNDSISKLLIKNDYIILGDLDEIPNKELLKKIKREKLIPKNEHITLCLDWHMYYLKFKVTTGMVWNKNVSF